MKIPASNQNQALSAWNSTTKTDPLRAGSILHAQVTAVKAGQQIEFSAGGQRFVSQGPASVSVGQTISLAVLQPPGYSRLEINNVPSERIQLSREQILVQAPESLYRQWRSGQLIPALIVSQHTSGTSLLHIQGQFVTAHTLAKLPLNTVLQLRMAIQGDPAFMQITNVPGTNEHNKSNTVPTIWAALPKSIREGLTTGQILSANVVTSSESNGHSRIQVAGQILNIISPLPLTQGQSINLRVVDNSAQPLLALLHSNSPQAIAMRALREALPQQMSLGPLLANLHFLQQGLAVGNGPPVSEQLQLLARQILQRLPLYNQLQSTANIQSQLARSGLYLEHLLSLAPTASMLAEKDMKALLLRLLQLVKQDLKSPTSIVTPGKDEQSPPPLPRQSLTACAQSTASLSAMTGKLTDQAVLLELFRQTSGALARLQISQLSALSDAEDVNRPICVELPIRHAEGVDLFQLRIQHDKSGNDKETLEKVMEIDLAFALQALGPVQVKLRLRGQSLNALFWAEELDTQTLINKHLPLFQRNLISTGLLIEQCLCQHGKPPQSKNPTHPSKAIIDVRA